MGEISDRIKESLDDVADHHTGIITDHFTSNETHPDCTFHTEYGTAIQIYDTERTIVVVYHREVFVGDAIKVLRVLRDLVDEFNLRVQDRRWSRRYIHTDEPVAETREFSMIDEAPWKAIETPRQRNPDL